MSKLQSETSDLEKAFEALSFVTSVRSVGDLLVVFGLQNLPTAQKYGILFGCLTFATTVSAVLFLLVKGGSFKRMEEQAHGGYANIPGSIEERVTRPLLLERLLEAQARLLQKYPKKPSTESPTEVTKMLMNVAPDVAKAKEFMSSLVDEKDEKVINKKRQEVKKFIPAGYEHNYIKAYRKCQDKPGGPAITGEPEARYEAYARAYAGCGTHTSASYRRSYARMYEAVACVGHANEAKYRNDWLERPQDIVGRNVRLEALDADRHLKEFFAMTCGDVYRQDKSFDPHEIWAFWPEGPFKSPDDMRKSFVFHRNMDEAGFAIVEALTDNIIGVIFLTNDNPQNLSISLEMPILKPSSEGTAESIEACFLLLDRLFAMGYRRIQLSIDSMDISGKKLCGRIGLTQEGFIPKERIVKESNRDSIIYGMLNSDWDKGARSFLFKKLHGDKATQTDAANETKEDELDKQQEGLAKKRAEESAAKLAASEKK
eukprot:CAMPEP_0194075286 /NCGR_PEP_ID=MMETSP0149-20130528/2326_1 /TAXON_ID=122233 /ORGANISM="Chaetoceros debilis, Strain MM31A-1" /LENGTH=485 /DNA_ID=CAMNT_0038755723 /DNA_START=45 /DNA_END=1502 /DNA_ORIENTATION=-